MVRAVFGIVVGIVVAFALVIAGETVLHIVSPVAAPDMHDPEAMKTFMANVPMTLKLGLIVTYAVAAFGGALVAAWVGRRAWSGWVVAVALILAGGANFLMLPHPVWIVAASMAAYVIGGWLGARVGSGLNRA